MAWQIINQRKTAARNGGAAAVSEAMKKIMASACSSAYIHNISSSA